MKPRRSRDPLWGTAFGRRFGASIRFRLLPRRPQLRISRLRVPPSLRRWGKAMYVAVRRYEDVTDPQRVAKVAEEDFVPIISELPGFVAHYTLDAGDGVMVGISVFEHKDAEEQSTYRAGELVGEHLEPLLPNPPQVTAGEVVVYKTK